jgi:MerR family copper efflux transcriptional regulator
MKIGDLARATGVPPKTIRYYEEIGLLPAPPRADNRYRSYEQRDVATLRFIGRARSLGFPLKDVASLLELYRDRNRASHEVKQLALRRVEELDRKIAELTTIRRAIADLAARCHGDDHPDCPILEDLEGGDPPHATEPHRPEAALTAERRGK